jgi:SAM-dependent methyltransferase
MRNAEQWQPSKFVFRRGRLRASRNPSEVWIPARVIADLTACWYERQIPLHARGRLLDLGCGAVPLFQLYRDRVDSITCVDWQNTLHGGGHLDVECDLSESLPLRSGEFDTIILSDVLEHLPDPAFCWSEMGRLLVAGGKVILNVPFFYHVHEAPFDFYRYTRFALQRFAEREGFEVVTLEPIGGVVECTATIASEVLMWMRLAPLAKLVQAGCMAFSRSRLGLRLANSPGERFPLSYGMIARKR